MKKKLKFSRLLALSLILAMLCGCAERKITTQEQPTEPSQSETAPEQTPAQEEQDENQPEAETESAQEKTPEEENMPEETLPEPQPELTEEQKRRMKIEALVAKATVWDEKTDYDTYFTKASMQAGLAEFLYQNWDAPGFEISSYLDADDGRINLYQNSLEEYICVLSHVDTFQQIYLRADIWGSVSAFTPSLAAEEVDAPQELQALLINSIFDERYDEVYFDDQMEKEANETYRAYAKQAEAAFLKALTENQSAWKTVLEDKFRVTTGFDDNDQFVLTIQGKTLYWLELRYMPGHGVWYDLGLWEDDEDWELDAGMLTDEYLVQLVGSMELGMTAAPFTFDGAKQLNAQQLWLCYLLLTPEDAREAARGEDGLYHVTKDKMEKTLSKYFTGYTLDITQIPGVDVDGESGEITAKTLSGFGGENWPGLREKTVSGNTVTFTVDYYQNADMQEVAKTKQYTITFRKGGYTYDKSLDVTKTA